MNELCSLFDEPLNLHLPYLFILKFVFIIAYIYVVPDVSHFNHTMRFSVLLVVSTL